MVELFSTDSPTASYDRNNILVVVILSTYPPDSRVKVLLQHHSYRRRLHYYLGSSKSIFDLQRIAVHGALSVLVLPDTTVGVAAESLRETEDAVFLAAVFISKVVAQTQKQIQLKHQRMILLMSSSSTGLSSSVFSAPHRPIIMTKLVASARTRAVLQRAGVDIVLSLQVYFVSTFESHLATLLTHSLTLYFSSVI